MKRYLRFFVIVFAFSCCLPHIASAQVVNIPDANLEAALRELFEANDVLGPNEPITRRHMEAIISLDLGLRGINDLTGLEFAENIKELSIIFNKVSDLSSLSGLKQLNVLWLGINPIRDLSPIAGLTWLVELRGQGTRITDLSPLSKLTRLKILDMPESDISNLSPLAELTQLEELNLRGNQVHDLSPLTGLTQLELLRLADNQIQDVSPLTRMTKMKELSLERNNIRDVSPLTGLVNLEELQLRGNPVQDTSPLASLTKLVDVDVKITAPLPRPRPVEPKPVPLRGTDLIPDPRLAAAVREALGLGPNAPITKQTMKRLMGLWAGSRQIQNLTGLEHATQLEELSLGYNQISDIRPLAGMTQLRRLFLGSNQISDISPLAGLTRLRELSLSRNDIRDVSPLAGLVNLQRLWLVENPITDTSPLTSLTKLVEVDIKIAVPVSKGLIPDPNLAAVVRGTLGLAPNARITKQAIQRLTSLQADNRQIKNLDGLEHATQLTALYLWDNQISDVSLLARLTQLERLILDSNQIRDLSPLAGLTQLVSLGLIDNRISDVRPLAKLTKLEYLALNNNQIRDIRPLAGLVNLERLRLAENPITDTALLSSLTNLVEVDIEIPTIADATNTIVSVSPSQMPSPAIGEQLTLSLKITDGKNVAGYQATISYDTSALRYVESSNGDYLPTGAFFVPPIVNGNGVKLGSTALTGVSNGDGTLATLTFEVVAAKASTLTVSDVFLADSEGNTVSPQVEGGQVTKPARLAEDLNSDGVVNIQDLVLVASNFGQVGENVADVNGDGVVNITDLVKVAGALGNAAAAPSLHPQALQALAAADVQKWLFQAQFLDLTDLTSQRGVRFLEQLLEVLIPKETVLLPNYPNSFNPETWIPYQLAKPADVTLTIYAMNGKVVRRLVLGHQLAGSYQSRDRAVYWDGRNALGEPVASGLYFYTLTAGDFTATRKMLIRK